MTGEIAAFQAFRDGHSSDALIDLLRAHQGRVFRLCYQVLHNAHDAEDAAQEVLLKIPGEVRRFPDHESFRRWLNRVSLNAALEFARKAARRRAHETRAAMQKTEPEPLDASTRLALFEALAAIDDAPRNLLLDHYFEGESLETIADRAGCSAPAVCKKMDGARESLRRRLGGVGAMIVLPDFKALFPPAPVAPDLVTGAVLAKAATFAGGIAMTTKSTVLIAVVITAIVCLSAGTGLGVLLGSRANGPSDVRAEVPGIRRVSAAPPKVTTPPDTDLPAPPAPATKVEPAKPAESALTTRLNRYKQFMDAWKREREELLPRLKADVTFANEYSTRKYAEQTDLLQDLWSLVFAEPEAFMTFMRDSANETYLEQLPTLALGFASRTPGQGYTMVRAQAFTVFPAAIGNGMIDLLKSGTAAQRSAAMNFFSRVTGAPPELREVVRGLLDDPDPSIQAASIGVLTGSEGTTADELKVLIRVGRDSADETVRTRIANAMRYIDKPEAAAYLMDRLESPRDNAELISSILALSHKFVAAPMLGSGAPPKGADDRILQAAAASWSQGLDENGFRIVVYSVLCVPGDKIRTVLEQGLGAAPTDKSKEMLALILARMNEGESSRDVLRTLTMNRK